MISLRIIEDVNNNNSLYCALLDDNNRNCCYFVYDVNAKRFTLASAITNAFKIHQSEIEKLINDLISTDTINSAIDNNTVYQFV